MEELPVTMRIKEMMNEFSEKETSIANYILNNKDTFSKSSISSIANTLNIANSTLTSFSKKIGYSGFSQLKIALLSEHEFVENSNNHISDESSSLDIANMVFTSSINHLSNTLHLQTKENLDKAVNLILNSNSIQFFGLGGSNAVAYDFYHQFLRLPIKSNYSSDFHIQLMNASQLRENDCAFLISHTGRNKDCIRIAEILKENHCKIILLTSSPLAPLSKYADIVLASTAKEVHFHLESLSSRISMFAIVDTLFVCLTTRLKDKASEEIKSNRDLINKTRLDIKED